MLPRLKDMLFDRMIGVIFMIGNLELPSIEQLSIEQLSMEQSSLEQLSMEQGGNKRHPASESEVNLISTIIKPCPEERKEDKCIFCLENFSKLPLVVECPACHNIFCAHNNECQGFLRHLQEDRRCPTCRKDIKDWF